MFTCLVVKLGLLVSQTKVCSTVRPSASTPWLLASQAEGRFATLRSNFMSFAHYRWLLTPWVEWGVWGEGGFASGSPHSLTANRAAGHLAWKVRST